jgi:hypothetical protein
MTSALKAALERCRALLLAVAAGGAAQLAAGHADAAIDPELRQARAADERSWVAAERSRTPEAYQRYLELFPTGAHAEEAFRLLIELSFERRSVAQLVDIEPPAGPLGEPWRRVVAAADLALY